MKGISHFLVLGMAISGVNASRCRPVSASSSSASSSVSASASPLPPAPPPCTNVIEDGNFVSGLSSWTSGSQGAALVYPVSGSGCTSLTPTTSCAEIKLTPVEGETNNYAWIESAPFTLTQGVTYALSIDTYMGIGGSNLAISYTYSFNDVGNPQKRSVDDVAGHKMLEKRIGLLTYKTGTTVGTGNPQTLRIMLSSPTVLVTMDVSHITLIPASCQD